MDELLSFSQLIKSLIQDNEILDIKDAREIVKTINNFLYTNYESIGHTKALGKQTHTNCYERAVDHFMAVNHCGYSKFVEKERKAHKKWLKRSKHKWKLDINRDYINHLLEERVEV